MVQPEYCRCIPLETFNRGNNAIELVSGSSICQTLFF